MAQDKEEKKTEDETYKAEAAHRLELAKADEKRIREEIEALKKEIEKAKEAREGKVIDIQWAEEELADCRLLEEIAGRKKERLERIISSDSREELPDLIGFSPKQRVYADKDGKGGNDGKKEDKGKKEEKTPEEKRPAAPVSGSRGSGNDGGRRGFGPQTQRKHQIERSGARGQRGFGHSGGKEQPSAD